jgi:hypothetical protein
MWLERAQVPRKGPDNRKKVVLESCADPLGRAQVPCSLVALHAVLSTSTGARADKFAQRLMGLCFWVLGVMVWSPSLPPSLPPSLSCPLPLFPTLPLPALRRSSFWVQRASGKGLSDNSTR